MRCAIYFVPPREHPLALAAASWLRRDPYTGASLSAPTTGLSEDEHAILTSAPRRYGFHATMKAPFRLADGATLEALGERLDVLAGGLAPVEVELELAPIDEFFALVPRRRVPELDELAARVVTGFDSFRAPPDDSELARRGSSRLNERQLSYLRTWGYPYVLDEFRFHMTLTGPVAAPGQPRVRQAIEAHFGTGPHRIEVSRLAIAVEPEDQAPFLVHSIHSFAAASTRLRA